MKIPSAALLAMFAAATALPAPEADAAISMRDADVSTNAAYNCVVTLYVFKNWTGREKTFFFPFNNKEAPVCKHLGADYNDIASSIQVTGAGCECKLHVDTCGQGGDYEVPKIWPPGIKDLGKNHIDNRATSLTCKIR